MKFKFLSALLFSMVLVSCEKCKNDDEPIVDYSNGAFVVNEGSFGNLNGSITWTLNSVLVSNPFADANGTSLGDVISDFDIVNGKFYAVSNSTGKVIVMNATTFKVEAEITGFANDGVVTDYSPEIGEVFKIKTNYLSTKVCSAKSKDVKFVFNRIQYVCNQKNGKWIWVDFAPIAAAKSKYLTEKAFYLCGLNTNTLGAELTDKGKTLALDHVFKYFVSDAEFACVTSKIGMPGSVRSKMSMTRASDGIQSAKFGKISADWTETIR